MRSDSNIKVANGRINDDGSMLDDDDDDGDSRSYDSDRIVQTIDTSRNHENSAHTVFSTMEITLDTRPREEHNAVALPWHIAWHVVAALGRNIVQVFESQRQHRPKCAD